MSEVKSDKIGKWFYADYGFDLVVGRCVAVLNNGDYVLSFRWGGLFRCDNRVYARDVLGEAKDPRIISKVAAVFGLK